MRPMTKVRKQFILDQNKIRKVKSLLGAKTDTQAIDQAMEYLLANSQIEKVLRQIKGKGKIRDIYGRVPD